MNDSRTKALRQAARRAVDAAKAIVDAVEATGENLTPQQKNQIDKHLDVAQGYKAEADAIDKVTQKVAGIEGEVAPASEDGLFGTFKAAGWAPGKRVTIPASHLKTATFFGDADDLNPTRREGAGLGFDQRYLADVFPSTPIGSDVTSVQVLRQRSRTLPAAGDVQRALMATTEKAEVASVRELVTETIGQLAAKESGIPNALLSQNGIRSMVDADLRLAILESKDDAIMDAITAANPANAGETGIDLTEQIVFAAADMAEDGYAGTVVALSPTEYAALALLRGADEQFARRDPLAGFRIVQSKSITDPLLIAPASAGQRYEGPLALQSFEENDGATNTSLVRLEQSFHFAAERPAAIRVIGPAGS